MEASKIQHIQEKVEDVKLQMVANIEQTMKRDEKIHLLMDKTDYLVADSNRFREGARNLKNKLCTQNVKTLGAFSGAIGLMALVIYLVVKLDSH